MNDLTLLYYSASTIEDYLAENVRKHLFKINAGTYPIVSVSQKPLDFGTNLCVGEIGKSYYNCYKQIYIGAKKVKTKYVAMCEDDTLYSMEHFSHRPSSNKIVSFNKNMWYAEETEYWNKGWVGMCTCIVATEYLIDTLTPRFTEYPQEADVPQNMLQFFQEPGRLDYKFGITNAKTEYYYGKTPIVTFNYFRALGGKANSIANKPISVTELEPWGNCWDLKKYYWGRARPRAECKQRFI